MEISSVDVDVFPFEEKREEEIASFDWENMGKITFLAVTCIACAALAPALCRRRRVCSPPSLPSLPQAPIPSPSAVEISSPEEPLVSSPAVELASPSPFPAKQASLRRPLSPSYPIRCTSTDREDIEFLVRTVSQKGVTSLLWMKGTLETKGQKLKDSKHEQGPLHPLRFLEHAFSSAELRGHMRAILSHPLKKGKFIKDLGEDMEGELKKNNLFPHLEIFAQRVQCSHAPLIPLIEARKWEELLFHLTEKSGGQEG